MVHTQHYDLTAIFKDDDVSVFYFFAICDNVLSVKASWQYLQYRELVKVTLTSYDVAYTRPFLFLSTVLQVIFLDHLISGNKII